jgi:cytochrome P450
MSTPFIDEAAKVFTDPTAYADEPRLHAALTHLRAHAPVSLVDCPPYQPFWAITKYADIKDIERDHMLFIISPRSTLEPPETEEIARALIDAGMGLRTLLHMDDPEHRVMRAIGAKWFTPKAMRALKVRVDELAKMCVDKMAAAGPECDFVQEVASYPLYVIMSLLGLPESDFPWILKLVPEFLARDNEEFTRRPEEEIQVLSDFFGYFRALTASRRERPTEDLASAIANARIDGEPLSDVDAASYYTTMVVAAGPTTKATISGGLHALIENPDQRKRLQDNLDLMPLAIEEMIRWVTPTKETMRTATEDTTVHGIPIAKGESVLLSYASANRDEDVFDEPFRFDVGRNPNEHLSFGSGVHFCLGAALARMQARSFFTELLPRLKSIELNGKPELILTVFSGGLKHLPIRYSLR